MTRGIRPEARALLSGQVDSTDLIVGIILLVAVPVASLAAAAMLGLTTQEKKTEVRERVVPEPAPDQEEVDMRFRNAQEIYMQNAKPYLDSAQRESDSAIRLHLLKWAAASLRKADSTLVELEGLIRRHSDSEAIFQAYLAQISQLRGDVQKDLAKVKELDILGLTGAR